jgi:RNA polymerase sigma-70 factor, ECF subfamily
MPRGHRAATNRSAPTGAAATHAGDRGDHVNARTLDELLVAAKAGDEQSFATIWRELNPAVLRYLRVLVPGAAEDYAAEVWLEVVRGLGRFTGDEAGFRAWVFTIARHRGLDWRRHAARQPTAPLPSETLADRPAADDPAAAALEALATERALALIARLPPDQAEVVLLRVVAGLDVARVAGIVGKRPGTVRVLGHRGLRRLAELLGSGRTLGRGAAR